MNDMKKNIRRVFWLYFILFALVVVYLGKFTLIDSKDIITRSENPRLSKVGKNIMRGEIRDANGEVLARSVPLGQNYTREYPYGRNFSHVVGYAELGRAGVESKYNFDLQKVNLQVIQRVKNIMFGEPLKGNHVVLTLDAKLQELIADELGEQRGAVVVMEPSTGKLLSMVSYPNYDPNTVSQDWNTLINDTENSPLVNRATQGLYPPGSIFKILTAAADYEFLPDCTTFEFDCVGEAYFGNNRIRCFDSKVHKHETIYKAMSVSCNTFFSTIGYRLGGENLRTVSDRFFFNSAYPFPLEYSKSLFPLNGESSDSEIIETSIGQGKTLVTPVHMAMITSAVANGGLMMEPYLIDHVETSSGSITSKSMPESIGQVLTFEEATFLSDMMVDVVASGTGLNASISGVKVAGKTGTAENSSGDDHGWFIAFAPAENPKVAVSILLENSGGPRKAMGISKRIMEYVLGI